MSANAPSTVMASAKADDFGKKRNVQLKLAVMSSGLSKVTAFGLQALAIPLVYHALGAHQYALYLLITAALATVALMQLGAGPGLTQAIARNRALGKPDQEAGALMACLLFVLGTSLLGGSLCGFLVRAVSPGVLFGPDFGGDRAVIVHSADVAILIIVITMVLGVVDSALAGYQEQVLTNLGSAGANCVSTLALFLLCRYWHPDIVAVMLVLYGMPNLSRFINLIVLFIRRSYLLSGLRSVNFHNLKAMMHTGAAFWVIQATSVLEQHGGTYLMAHVATAESVAIFGIVFRVSGLISSAVGIFTQPLWPAFTDAVARKDFPWVNRAVRKIRFAVMSAASIVSAGMILLGYWGIEHFWHVKLGANHLTVIVIGCYLFSNLWTHFHYVILMGLDRVWQVGGLVLAENLAMLCIGRFLIPQFGAFGLGAAYLLASALLPAWILPGILHRRVREIGSLAAESGETGGRQG